MTSQQEWGHVRDKPASKYLRTAKNDNENPQSVPVDGTSTETHRWPRREAPEQQSVASARGAQAAAVTSGMSAQGPGAADSAPATTKPGSRRPLIGDIC